MPTVFNLLAKTCGLSLPEIAAWREVPLQTVKMWSVGTRSCPEVHLSALHGMAQRIEVGALYEVRRLKRLKTPIDLDSLTRHPAIPLGAHHAMLGRIVALLPDETEYE